MGTKKLVKLLAIALAGVLLCTTPILAAAEEYTSIEVESEDLPDEVTFSSSKVTPETKGDFISYGTVEVANEGDGVVGIDGSSGSSVNAKIDLDLYLDREPEDGSYTQIAYWNFVEDGVPFVSEYGDKTATNGTYYYRVCEAHSVKYGGVTESLSTNTARLKITR